MMNAIPYHHLVLCPFVTSKITTQLRVGNEYVVILENDGLSLSLAAGSPWNMASLLAKKDEGA